ncbi:type II restriction endonuclease [Intrasporangium sp.]|uniref:type II restriction endonuclease n=1 Tax=Intrasporangium sp. TaxID=1925024 RepID=UPI0033656C71
MSSPLADLVIQQAREHGLAFFKTLSANDVGVTKSHQSGFHLGIDAAPLFTPQAVEKGVNHKHPIRIRWTNGTVTESAVNWYGRESRREYRITRFNRIRNFYYRRPDRLGGTLVLIQEDEDMWLGHVLDDAIDVDEVMATLGLSLDGVAWTTYRGAEGPLRSAESSSNCEARLIGELVINVDKFPGTRRMSEMAGQIVDRCGVLDESDADTVLLHRIRVEYDLFRMLEERVTVPRLTLGFEGIEDFLALSQTVLQRRKARAGRSLELHIEQLLSSAGLNFEAQPVLDGTRPDFVIPSSGAYHALGTDTDDDDIMVVCVKTTCKDRWRQVLAEAPRARTRYLVTLQQGISQTQMKEIRENGVRLVVPREYHDAYAPDDRVHLITIAEFLNLARAMA